MLREFRDKIRSCASVEVIGLIIGWSGLVWASLVQLWLIYTAYDSKNQCTGKKILNNENCYIFVSVYRIVLYVILIINAVICYVYFQIVEGIKKKNPKNLRPALFMFTLGIYTFSYVIIIGRDYYVIVVLALIMLLIEVFFFVVILMIFRKLRSEPKENDQMPMVGVDI